MVRSVDGRWKAAATAERRAKHRLMLETSFLGAPGVDAWLFSLLALATFCSSLIGILTGAAGGVFLLAVMSMAFPPAVLIPLHTMVQLGAGSSRVMMMWSYVLKGTLLPFVFGAVAGVALGAQVFVALPAAALQGILGAFIIVLAWMPAWGRIGPERRRFAALGLGVAFLGMFVSAVGVLIAPFVASASPDRRNHAATMAALTAVVHIFKLVAFGLLGVAIAAYVPLVAAMIAMGVVGNWVGTRVLDRMPERRFRLLLQVILTGLALRLLWVAGSSAGWW
jgi:uncharacterized membrane protein YfcA